MLGSLLLRRLLGLLWLLWLRVVIIGPHLIDDRCDVVGVGLLQAVLKFSN